MTVDKQHQVCENASRTRITFRKKQNVINTDGIERHIQRDAD